MHINYKVLILTSNTKLKAVLKLVNEKWGPCPISIWVTVTATCKFFYFIGI